MAFDDNTDLNELEAPETGEAQPEESSNRTFVIVAVSLGAIMLLTLVCIAIFGLVYMPSMNRAKLTQNAQAYAQQTAVEIAAQQTMVAMIATPTFTATVPPSPTKAPASPTATSVVSKLSTATSTSTQENAATLTVAALYTKAALTQTALALTPTALPSGGFADEVGLPGLLALGGALVVIIFLARRLRTAS